MEGKANKCRHILNKLTTKTKPDTFISDAEIYRLIIDCATLVLCACFHCCVYVPAHQFEPMEAVVEGVTSCQRALAVLLVGGGHLSCAVIHLSHQVQPLPVNDDAEHLTLMRSRKYMGSSNGKREETLIDVEIRSDVQISAHGCCG